VVGRIDPEDAMALRSLAERMMVKAKAGKRFDEEDGQFHAVLFCCLKNDFLSRLLGLFWEVYCRLNEANVDMEKWPLEESASDHMKIVEMLEAGDKQGLLEAHKKHFHAAFERLKVAKTLLSPAAAGRNRTDIEPLSGLNLKGRLDRLIS
jgi:DNA-binding FadR family transcriptional regulator